MVGDSTDTDLDQQLGSSMWLRVPHDLRQPIQTLVLLSHSLSETADLGQRRQLALLMEDLLVGLQGMLDELGRLARLEAGLDTSKPTPCALPDLVARVAEDVAELGARSGVVLRTRAMPATVSLDERLLRALLHGLVVNAIKLGTGERVLLAVRQRGKTHRVEICFVGPVVHASHREAVFIELHGTQGKLPSPIFALGLAQIARTAAALGSRLEVTSLSKDLQRFALTLPRKES